MPYTLVESFLSSLIYLILIDHAWKQARNASLDPRVPIIFHSVHSLIKCAQVLQSFPFFLFSLAWDLAKTVFLMKDLILLRWASLSYLSSSLVLWPLHPWAHCKILNLSKLQLWKGTSCCWPFHPASWNCRWQQGWDFCCFIINGAQS